MISQSDEESRVQFWLPDRIIVRPKLVEEMRIRRCFLFQLIFTCEEQ